MYACVTTSLLASSFFFWSPAAPIGHFDAASVYSLPGIGGNPAKGTAASGSGSPGRSSSVMPPFGIAAVATTRNRRRKVAVVYTRFSTNDQNEQSLADQEAACRGALHRLGFTDCKIEVLSDAAISGESANRPGLNRLWELIETQACDVIIAEEVSRFYRHTTRAMQFIESAVDAEIRVITLNDPIDTSNDDWRLNSHFASLKAELDNRQTRQRIQRARQSRWEKGYVVHHTLKPGYARVPLAAPDDPARIRRPDYRRQPGYQPGREAGPFLDRLDEQATPVIERAFTMCANNEPTWVIARYLRAMGLPRCSQAPDNEWVEADVVKLIRDPIYRGEEVFARTHAQKRYSKGDAVRIRSAPDQVWRRPMPHLRHVPDWLWYAANQALDRRRGRSGRAGGPDHPLAGRRRDRRGALSTLFFCGVCGAPMYHDGNRYRCGNARPRPTLERKGIRRCWNRCMPSCEMVHGRLGGAVVTALLAQEGAVAALVAEVRRIVQHGDVDQEERRTQLERQLGELDRRCDRVARALETAPELETVVKSLSRLEGERRQVRTEIDRLLARKAPDVPLPGEEDVRRIVDEAKSHLLGSFGPEANPLLRRLITPIKARPYELFDTRVLVLRAHFDLKLMGLLTDEWRALLNDGPVERALAAFTFPMVVDLFKTPDRVQFARQVGDLIQAGLTVTQAAARLGIPPWTADSAATTANAMAERGLAEPFIPVVSMPTKRPPRWRPRSRPDVFDEA